MATDTGIVMIPQTEEELLASQIVSDFLQRESFYSDRNYVLDLREAIFEGQHWSGVDDKETQEYHLVYNYTRRIVLGNAAVFSRAPKPKVPIPTDIQERRKANAREKLLMIIWEDLMRAWYDVELNASKLSYGVIQVIWKPEKGQPEEVNVGEGEEEITKKRYTKNPFRIRSIQPRNFYPVYRTHDDASDFLKVYRYDPGRKIEELEKIYNVKLQQTGTVSPDGWTAVETEPTCDLIEHWTEDKYILVAKTKVHYMSPRRREVDVREEYHILANVENPYECIPFWVVQNIRSDGRYDPTYQGSIGDMDDITNLNRHFNHILSEQAEEIVTNIHRPIIYKSDDHQQNPNDLTMGPGEVFPVGLEEEVEPMEWRGDPPTVEQHLAMNMKAIQDLTFLGEAGFGKMDSYAQGLSARIALTPMQQLIELKIYQRRTVLQKVCEHILRVFEEMMEEDVSFQGWAKDKLKRFGLVTISKEDIGRQYFVDIDYGNMLPRDDYQYEQGEVYKYKTGAQSLLSTLDKLGFDDPEAERERIKEELMDPILNPEHYLKVQEAKTPLPQQQQTSPFVPRMGGQQQQQSQPSIGGGGGGQSMFGQPSPMTGQMLPGTAQPGTQPMQMNTQPPVPPSSAFPRSSGGGPEGPGNVAPFIRRKRNG